MKYAILDNTGICTNVTEWDGVSSWTPPQNTIAVLIDEPKIQSKYSYDKELNKWNLVQVPSIEPKYPGRTLNYTLFWDCLISSGVYKKIKNYAKSNLEINLCCTEFISLLLNAKITEPNKQQFQEVIWELFETLNQYSLVNQEDIAEMNELFNLYLFNQASESLEYTLARDVYSF